MIKYTTEMIMWSNQELSSFLKDTNVLGKKKMRWGLFPLQFKIFRKQND